VLADDDDGLENCPTEDTLRGFLEEHLDAPKRRRVGEHLESCVRCQASMQRVIFADYDEPRAWGPGDDRQIVEGLAKNAPPRPKPRSFATTPTLIDFPSPPTADGPLGQLDDYHIREQLGSGTYGVVYKAYERKLTREVALKLLRPELSGLAVARKRFEDEARAAAKVNNPHVLTIHGVFEGTGAFPFPFIAMEFLDGPTLRAHLRDHPKGLSLEAAVKLAQQTARGLAAAHARGVIHRDIKPENILLREEKGSWHVKITDFGIAQVLEDAQPGSPHGSIIGTPAYMSPEAFIAPETVDVQSDIYSLGVVLYELLTGCLPFGGTSTLDVRRAVEAGRFDLPRKLKPKIRPDLEAVVLKCMKRDPAARYESAAELAEQLGRSLDNEPLGAWRYTPRELIVLWSRRNRWLAAFLLAMASLALVGAGALFLAFLWQRSEARERARVQQVVNEARIDAATLVEKGRFDEAEKTLTRTIDDLTQRPELLGDRQSVEAQRALYGSMAKFRTFSDRAWFAAGEESGDPTLETCRAALDCYHVLDNPDWAKSLAQSALPAATVATVKAEVHRLLLLMGAMQIEAAIIAYRRSDESVVAKQSDLASKSLQKARVLEDGKAIPFSKTAALLQRGVVGISRLKTRANPQTGNAPAVTKRAPATLLENLTEEDGFFLGVLHVYVAKNPKDTFAQTIALLGPTSFDFEHPRATAISMLRTAVRQNPKQYWSNFMLGRILAFPDPASGQANYEEAVQVFNTCIADRGDYSRGYEQRALTSANLAIAAALGESQKLQAEAIADLNEAIKLAPDDASTHWVRGQTFALLGKISEAVKAYTQALVLDKDLQKRISRRNQLAAARELALQALKAKPGDPDAAQLLKLADQARAQ
jgi:tetratricopeptide (TPR) repeat protein